MVSVVCKQTYSAGDYAFFANQADFVAGVNSTRTDAAPDAWMRDGLSSGTVDYRALNSNSGDVYASGSVVANAAWAAGNVDDFSYNQSTGAFEVRLTNAVAGLGVAGDYIGFTNQANFIAGVGSTLINATPDAWMRDGVSFGTTDYRALNSNSGDVYALGSVVANAAWAAGNVDDFSYNQNTGAFEVRFSQTTTLPVPEPSSATLLGLGGLALILRRRK